MVTENKDTVDIIVNMQKKVVPTDALTPDGEISFDQVVSLASEGGGLPSGPYIDCRLLGWRHSLKALIRWKQGI